MDRAFVGHLGRISTNPEGNPENGVPDQQTIGYFSVSDSDVPVALVRVNDPNAGRIWLFSAETLAKVPDLYDNVEAHQVESKLPPILVRTLILGMPLWQWLALIAAIPVAVIIGWVAVLLLAIPRRLYLIVRKRPNLHSYGRSSKPLLLCFGALAHRFIAPISVCLTAAAVLLRPHHAGAHLHWVLLVPVAHHYGYDAAPAHARS